MMAMEKKGKILIVDDNEDVLLSLNMLLKPYVEGIRVINTPERIIGMMDSFMPDVIMLDMNFPCWNYQLLFLEVSASLPGAISFCYLTYLLLKFILSYFPPKNAFTLNLLIIRMFENV